MKIELRNPVLSDARRYVEILSNPDFTYFPAKPATLKEEKDFLRKSKLLRKAGSQFDFAVMADGIHVGAAGIRLHPQFRHICEIGYFVDRRYWNKGIATRAVQLLEEFIHAHLNIVRIELIAAKKNAPSCRVAVKSGYTKEGVMKKYLNVADRYYDCNLYAKIVK